VAKNSSVRNPKKSKLNEKEEILHNLRFAFKIFSLIIKLCPHNLVFKFLI
jgi:hypothetical protein